MIIKPNLFSFVALECVDSVCQTKAGENQHVNERLHIQYRFLQEQSLIDKYQISNKKLQ